MMVIWLPGGPTLRSILGRSLSLGREKGAAAGSSAAPAAGAGEAAAWPLGGLMMMVVLRLCEGGAREPFSSSCHFFSLLNE